MNEVENIGDVLTDTVTQLGTQFADFAPKFIGALIVTIIGYILAKIVKSIVGKTLSTGKLGEILDGDEVKKNLSKVGMTNGVGAILASVFYWLIFLMFIRSASDILGLEIVGETIDALFGFIPKIVSAIIVIVIAVVLARVVNKAVAASLIQMQINFAGVIASVASSLILMFGALMAVTQLGFETDLITTNITLLIGGFIAAMALAIGLGSRGAVANIVAGYHGQQMYKVGQHVKIGSVKGKVSDVSNVAVTIHHDGVDEVIPFSTILNS